VKYQITYQLKSGGAVRWFGKCASPASAMKACKMLRQAFACTVYIKRIDSAGLIVPRVAVS
jgi:hypothetical protein